MRVNWWALLGLLLLGLGGAVLIQVVLAIRGCWG